MMLFQRCKKHLANPLIELDGIPTCLLCGPTEVEEKQQHTKKKKNRVFSGDFSEITCSLCKKIKKRKRTKGYDYVDENGNKWLRRRCPDCRPAMIYKQNIKRERKLEDRQCLNCKTTFRPKNDRHVYCSTECQNPPKKTKKKSITVKPVKELNRAPKVALRTMCVYCHGVIRAADRPRSYCNKQCSNKFQYENNTAFRERLKRLKQDLKNSPSYKAWRQYKRLYGNKISVKAKLGYVTWHDLDVYYNNCPPNHVVKVTIPLYDEDVCGLFVPWNLSYMSST